VQTDPDRGNPGLTALSSLLRFAQPRPARERCELCDAALAADHAHLVEVASRRLICACDACAILFHGQAETRYRRVPGRAVYLRDFRLTEETWDALQLPINLAFFVRSTPAGRVVAFYPSPAGATESPLELESWRLIVAESPGLHNLEPDVEALLVNRVAPALDCFRVGIDECYKLVGVIRTHWRGLSGGHSAWDEIDRFFADLKRRSS
jgi:hypothetical protein